MARRCCEGSSQSASKKKDAKSDKKVKWDGNAWYKWWTAEKKKAAKKQALIQLAKEQVVEFQGENIVQASKIMVETNTSLGETAATSNVEQLAKVVQDVSLGHYFE